jgi:hypothetical protein
MRQMKHTRGVMVSLLGGAVLVAAAMAACGGSIAPTPLSPTIPTITALPSIDEMLSDKTLGSTSAPNTIVEYVSFWCTACKDFHLTGDGAQMKTQLADTLKAQIIFRNLFLSGETASAAMLARCAGNARFFDAVNTIFQNQASWLGSSDPDLAVQRMMLGFGMSQSVVNACVSNTSLQNGLGQIHTAALSATYLLPDGTQRVGTATQSSILSVPAVVVNGVLLDGANAAGNADPANAPTLANVQKFLK